MRAPHARPGGAWRVVASFTMESRLTDLEIRYTHLERQVAELSEVVYEQQRTIDGLLRQLTATKAEIAQLSAPVTNEKPPHY
jgi:uncharacterized coiled-coil protein SlyX